MAPVLKTGDPKGSAGSNPAPSAKSPSAKGRYLFCLAEAAYPRTDLPADARSHSREAVRPHEGHLFQIAPCALLPAGPSFPPLDRECSPAFFLLPVGSGDHSATRWSIP